MTFRQFMNAILIAAGTGILGTGLAAVFWTIGGIQPDFLLVGGKWLEVFALSFVAIAFYEAIRPLRP